MLCHLLLGGRVSFEAIAAVYVDTAFGSRRLPQPRPVPVLHAESLPRFESLERQHKIALGVSKCVPSCVNASGPPMRPGSRPEIFGSFDSFLAFCDQRVVTAKPTDCKARILIDATLQAPGQMSSEFDDLFDHIALPWVWKLKLWALERNSLEKPLKRAAFLNAFRRLTDANADIRTATAYVLDLLPASKRARLRGLLT